MATSVSLMNRSRNVASSKNAVNCPDTCTRPGKTPGYVFEPTTGAAVIPPSICRLRPVMFATFVPLTITAPFTAATTPDVGAAVGEVKYCDAAVVMSLPMNPTSIVEIPVGGSWICRVLTLQPLYTSERATSLNQCSTENDWSKCPVVGT